MKVAIINDTHFGARSDSQIFIDYFMRFFEDVFFPYLKENDIDTVLHLGDLMDRRKFVNFNTLQQVRSRFMEPLHKEGITVHCILGNHDTYYKNTNNLNSSEELFGSRYNKFHIYSNPVEVPLGDMCIAMIPWINKENKDDTLKFLKKTKCQIVAGHFELNGYQVMRGVKMDGGMDDDPLQKFDMVLSGHFHQKHSKDNVHYLGTQYQITFSDLGEQKGFHIFDTETRRLEFVPNPDKMFHSMEYDDKQEGVAVAGLDSPTFYDHLNGSYIKLYVKNKTQPYAFDRFLDKLYESGVESVTIVEEAPMEDVNEDDVIDMAQDTVTLIYNEIDDMEDVEDKGKLKKIIRDLYMESLSL